MIRLVNSPGVSKEGNDLPEALDCGAMPEATNEGCKLQPASQNYEIRGTSRDRIGQSKRPQRQRNKKPKLSEPHEALAKSIRRPKPASRRLQPAPSLPASEKTSESKFCSRVVFSRVSSRFKFYALIMSNTQKVQSLISKNIKINN